MTLPVEVQQLTKYFDKQPAVHALSFQAEKGKVLGFLGPNGAGKSTTMKMLTGYLQPSHGKVWIGGYDLSTHPRQAKQRIGYLPEHNPMYLDMYVREYLQFMGQVRGLSRKQALASAQELIVRCGITEMQNKKLRALSKGYRQRVGLAQALIHDPEVLILDEPTTGLDPNQLREIRTLIKEVSQDKAVILSTHIMQEVEALCDQVLIISHGEIKAHDTLAQLTTATNHQVVVEFQEPVSAPLLEQLPGVQQLQPLSDRKFLLMVSPEQDIQAALLQLVQENGWTLAGFQQRQPSLEEVFQSLTVASSS